MSEDKAQLEDDAVVGNVAAQEDADDENTAESIYTEDGVVLESLLEATRLAMAAGEAEAVRETLEGLHGARRRRARQSGRIGWRCL